MDFNFSYPTITGKERKIEINDKVFVSIKHFKRGAAEYSLMTLHLKGKKVFLGKFYESFESLNVKYKDGKLLLYCGNENIITVLSLYEIIDDMFYCCTAEEAIKIFDSTLDTTYLQNKNNLICREDIEKKNKVL